MAPSGLRNLGILFKMSHYFCQTVASVVTLMMCQVVCRHGQHKEKSPHEVCTCSLLKLLNVL